MYSKNLKFKEKIHNLIPGGAHTYSKGDDQFPEIAPSAISYGKGAYVWDLDGNKFLDCSMGLASVSLGHAYKPVIERVKIELEKGVNFQRPSYIELEMAEKFLSLIPQHQMIKFAKNGSTVTTAAVKLARAYTGRKLVAFPYDHPFYSYDDWFICKTPCNFGIPEEINNLSVTYKSDNLKSLEELFIKYPNQIACVISEPEKNFGIPDNYLRDAIELTHKNGALYIVDEMITGFKTYFPGSFVKYGVEPDLATWGKGIANGFSFSALTGKREIMELGGIKKLGQKKLFLISTTHGAETHSIAAAMATIDEFLKFDVVKHIHKIGEKIINGCQEIIENYGVERYLEVVNCKWQPLFIFRDKELNVSLGFKTLFMQEMIKNGVLFQGIFQPCFSHKDSEVEIFLTAFENSVRVYNNALEDGYKKFLIGNVIKPVFREYV